jgi:hemoglobin
MLSAPSEASPAASAPSPFERLGGAPVFEAIAARFYDLMDTDPAYARLRAMHAADLAPVRASLPRFLAGWAGGPRDWFEENLGRCMMSLHSAMPIDAEIAGQWAEAMERAIADVAPQPSPIAASMSDTLARLARGMAR